MLGGIANQILHPLGRHMERLHEGELAWNHSIVLNFPVELRPRWGYGASPNPFVQSVLDNARWRYKEVVEQIGAIWDTLLLIPDKIALGNDHQPYWDNDWFSGLDAVSLAAFLVARRPARYIEIGSGFSTKFCRWVVKHHNLDTRIISIDPHPRAEIDDLCDEIIRSPLEACDQSVFDQLEANDILFFDGSHRVLQNSDVTVFFLEVLPRLKPGVIIHVHDIFLPYDYPPAWTKRVFGAIYARRDACFWSEFRSFISRILRRDRPDFRQRIRHYRPVFRERLKNSTWEASNACWPRGIVLVYIEGTLKYGAARHLCRQATAAIKSVYATRGRMSCCGTATAAWRGW